MIEIILGSRSPRRRQLIQLVGHPHTTMSAAVDESSINHSDPATNAMETALLKARAIQEQVKRDEANKRRRIIITADTTVALDNEMLGKPADAAAAGQMLRRLRGRPHRVHTGMALIDLDTGRVLQDVTTTTVTMRDYSDEEIAAYIASGDPMDKAGAYAIQNATFHPVAHLNGCYLAVMGLSICHLLELLAQFHVPLQADLLALDEAHDGHSCSIYHALLTA